MIRRWCPPPRTTPEDPEAPGYGNPDALHPVLDGLGSGADAVCCTRGPGRCWSTADPLPGAALAVGRLDSRVRSRPVLGRTEGRLRTERDSDGSCLGAKSFPCVPRWRAPPARGWTRIAAPGRLLVDPGCDARVHGRGRFVDSDPLAHGPRGWGPSIRRRERRPVGARVRDLRWQRRAPFREPEPSGRLDRGENQTKPAARSHGERQGVEPSTRATNNESTRSGRGRSNATNDGESRN